MKKVFLATMMLIITVVVSAQVRQIGRSLIHGTQHSPVKLVGAYIRGVAPGDKSNNFLLEVENHSEQDIAVRASFETSVEGFSNEVEVFVPAGARWFLIPVTRVAWSDWPAFMSVPTRYSITVIEPGFHGHQWEWFSLPQHRKEYR